MVRQYHYFRKRVQSGEVYFSEDISRPYVAGTVSITNSDPDLWLDIPAGYPFVGNALATKDNVSTADGFLIETQLIPPNTTEKHGVFVDGVGVTVNIDLLPEEDVAGDKFASDYQSRMEALRFVLKDSSELSCCGSC